MKDPMDRLDNWLTTEPETGCQGCSDSGCVDGEIVGRGSLGENVEEKCSCNCHESPEAIEEDMEDARADAEAWRAGA